MLEQLPKTPIETIIKNDVWFYILSWFSTQEICVLALVGRIWKQGSAEYINKQFQALIGKGLVSAHLKELCDHQFQNYFSKILKAEQLFEITVEGKTFHITDFYSDEHRRYFVDPKNKTSTSKADMLADFLDSLEAALTGSSFTEKLNNQELPYQLRFKLVGLYQNVESCLAMMMLGVQMAYLWKMEADRKTDPKLDLSIFIASPLTTQLMSRDFIQLDYYLFKFAKSSLILSLLQRSLATDEQISEKLKIEKIISRINTDDLFRWLYRIEKNELDNFKLFLLELAVLETDSELLIDKIFPLFGILLIDDFPTAKDLPVIKKGMTSRKLRDCLDVIEHCDINSEKYVAFINLMTKEFQLLINPPVLIRIFSLASRTMNIEAYIAFTNTLLDEFDEQINDRVINAIIRFLPDRCAVNIENYRRFVDSLAERCTSLTQRSITIIFDHIHQTISEAEYRALITFYLDKSSAPIQAAILRRIFSVHTNMPTMTIREYWIFLNSLVEKYLPAFVAAGSHIVIDMYHKRSPLNFSSTQKITALTLQDFEEFKCLYQILLEIKPQNDAEEDNRNTSLKKIDEILGWVFLQQPTLYLPVINYRLGLIKQLSLPDQKIYDFLYYMPRNLSSYDYKAIVIRLIDYIDSCSTLEQILRKIPQLITPSDYCEVSQKWINKMEVIKIRHSGIKFSLLKEMPNDLPSAEYATVVGALLSADLGNLHDDEVEQILNKIPASITSDDYLTVVNAMSAKLKCTYSERKHKDAILGKMPKDMDAKLLPSYFSDPSPSEFKPVFKPIGSHHSKPKSSHLLETTPGAIVTESKQQDFVEEQISSFVNEAQTISQDTDSPVPTEIGSNLNNEPANENHYQPREIDSFVVQNRSNLNSSEQNLVTDQPLYSTSRGLEKFLCFSTQFILAAILFSVGILISAFWPTAVTADVFGGLLISSIVCPIIGICAQCVISSYDYQQWKVNHRDGSSFLGDQLRLWLPKTFAGRVCFILGFHAFLALIGVSIAFFIGNADCVQFLTPLFNTVHHFLTAGLSLFGSNLAMGVEATNIFSAFFLCVMPLLILELGRRTPLFYPSSREPLNKEQDHLDHQHSNLNEQKTQKGQDRSSFTPVMEPVPFVRAGQNTYNVEQGLKSDQHYLP